MQKISNATLVIANGKICTPFITIDKGAVVVSGNKISYVGPANEVDIPRNTKKVDAKGGYIFPGFVDLHVNGGGGRDITEATEDAIYGIAEGHAKCGTTGVLVAITGPTEDIAKKGLKSAAKLSKTRTGGSRILGAQMEGPFVNPKKRGPVFAGFPESKPSIDVIKRFIDAGEGCLKLITMAPELEGNIQIIEYLVKNKIIASIGHMEATFDDVENSIKAGVTYAAHMYNAMTPFNHRDPGSIGALLISSENVTIEMVSDGHHVHPGAIKLALLSKGTKPIILVTDATEIVGTNRTSFTLPVGEGLVVQVKDGRTWGPNGQLIGSVLQMNHAVRNMVRWFNFISLSDVVASATWYPAKVIGAESQIGSIEVGKLADLAVLDQSFETIATVVDGEIIFSV
jgi:N-acetylglucosamine-6-phosphate deacetylase